jgi:hypothetical protein
LTSVGLRSVRFYPRSVPSFITANFAGEFSDLLGSARNGGIGKMQRNCAARKK